MAMIAVWNKEYKSSEEFRQKYNKWVEGTAQPKGEWRLGTKDIKGGKCDWKMIKRWGKLFKVTSKKMRNEDYRRRICGMKQTDRKWPQSQRMKFHKGKLQSNRQHDREMKRPKWCEGVGADSEEDRRWQNGGRGENWIERVRVILEWKRDRRRKMVGVERLGYGGRAEWGGLRSLASLAISLIS